MKLLLDVRTKFVLLIVTSVVILKASFSGPELILMVFLAAMPFLLQLMYKRTAAAFGYLLGFAAVSILSLCEFGPVVMTTCGIFTRLLPVYVVGQIFISETKVNEYTSAMDKMKIPPCISIPIAVLFRFFPTLKEEYQSISNAMKMRGIRFGGKHPGKMIEYRMIPFLMSSLKIGDELSAAALTRGLGAPVKRTSIAECRFTLLDIIVLIICTMVLLLFVMIEFEVI